MELWRRRLEKFSVLVFTSIFWCFCGGSWRTSMPAGFSSIFFPGEWSLELIMELHRRLAISILFFCRKIFLMGFVVDYGRFLYLQVFQYFCAGFLRKSMEMIMEMWRRLAISFFFFKKIVNGF